MDILTCDENGTTCTPSALHIGSILRYIRKNITKGIGFTINIIAQDQNNATILIPNLNILRCVGYVQKGSKKRGIQKKINP